MKRFFLMLFVVPIIFALAVGGINVVGQILGGEISLVDYLNSHSIIIGIIATYLIVRFAFPGKS